MDIIILFHILIWKKIYEESYLAGLNYRQIEKPQSIYALRLFHYLLGDCNHFNILVPLNCVS